jgi:hypothetical protein
VTPKSERRLPDPTYFGVLAIAGGLVLTWLHHPRIGLYLIALVLAGLAALRLVLPARDAGLLVVRGRSFDVAVLAGLSAAVFVVASVTPFPPAGS